MILLLQTIWAEVAAPASAETTFLCLLAVCWFVYKKSWVSQLNVTRLFPIRAKWKVKIAILKLFSVGGSCLGTSVHANIMKVRCEPSHFCTAAPFHGPWVSLACCELDQQPICFPRRSDCKHFSLTVHSPPPRRTSTSKSVQSATLQEADWGEPEGHPTAARSLAITIWQMFHSTTAEGASQAIWDELRRNLFSNCSLESNICITAKMRPCLTKCVTPRLQN